MIKSSLFWQEIKSANQKLNLLSYAQTKDGIQMRDDLFIWFYNFSVSNLKPLKSLLGEQH